MPPPDPLERVRAAARLAQIALEPAEELALAADLELILGRFSVLAEVDVEGLEPLFGPHPPRDGTRPDEPRPCLARQVLLANAPEHEDGHYKVPRAFE
jgi:aspartyl-tRNA(Asn)/glutamyl-tRNA(Gln) amidotransferase subunit C